MVKISMLMFQNLDFLSLFVYNNTSLLELQTLLLFLSQNLYFKIRDATYTWTLTVCFGRVYIVPYIDVAMETCSLPMGPLSFSLATLMAPVISTSTGLDFNIKILNTQVTEEVEI